MAAIANVGNFASGTIIAGYMGLVIYNSFPDVTNSNSNLVQLLKNAESDYGYVEFLIAAGVIAALYDVKVLRPAVGALVALTAVGFLLTKGPGSNVLAYLQNFGSGKIGLFGETPPSSTGKTNASSAVNAPTPPQAPKPAQTFGI